MIDYQKNHTLRGGYLADIPEPHVRFWPGAPRKRKVTATIMRFYGEGEHYYFEIKQEHNPIWNEKEQLWQSSWDDVEGMGKNNTQMYLDGEIEKTRLDAYQEAVGYIKFICKQFFPDHEIVWDDYCKDWEPQ